MGDIIYHLQLYKSVNPTLGAREVDIGSRHRCQVKEICINWITIYQNYEVSINEHNLRIHSFRTKLNRGNRQ